MFSTVQTDQYGCGVLGEMQERNMVKRAIFLLWVFVVLLGIGAGNTLANGEAARLGGKAPAAAYRIPREAERFPERS